MSTMTQDEITEVNEAVGRRWRSIDPLLPEPTTLPEGCGPLIKATGKDGRPVGLAVCHHQLVPADSLSQTWDAAAKFTLTVAAYSGDMLAPQVVKVLPDSPTARASHRPLVRDRPRSGNRAI